jgi:hypothetical protein
MPPHGNTEAPEGAGDDRSPTETATREPVAVEEAIAEGTAI